MAYSHNISRLQDGPSIRTLLRHILTSMYIYIYMYIICYASVTPNSILKPDASVEI